VRVHLCVESSAGISRTECRNRANATTTTPPPGTISGRFA